MAVQDVLTGLFAAVAMVPDEWLVFVSVESQDVVPAVLMAFEKAESKDAALVDCPLPVFYLPAASYHCYPADVYFRFYRYKHYLDGLMA